jgi:sialate O-acetylesterase
VPHCWENDGLGGYDGIAWYRLHITITPEQFELWKDRPLAVALGFIDDADETYLNGIQIGKTGSIPPAEQSGYMTPRLYPFDHTLLQTNNVLAVRVSDWGGSGGIWHDPIAIGPRSELEDVIEEMK